MKQRLELIPRLLAPYFAVVVFWCIYSNAWLAILAYHAQIVLWALHERPSLRRVHQKHFFLLALPTIVTGALLYFLLPYITKSDLALWLSRHDLSYTSMLVMIPYFGLVHPFLEQVHWTLLREQTYAAHFLFAGYHLLVLYALLPPLWLVVCFIVLTGASFAWHQIWKRSGSIWAPYLSHALADSGVIIASLLRL